MGGGGVNLDTFIVNVFCWIDDIMKILYQEQKMRERGAEPTLGDSEVLTIETVGEYLGLDQDQQIFKYFRSHFSHFFPNLRQIHRTTFVRQAANLWQAKEKVWQFITTLIRLDSHLAIVDSLPVPVCQFARAYRCQLFPGEAAFGKDMLTRQTFYGFRIHVRLSWPGIITRLALVPANVHELSVVYELVEDTPGLYLGDRNFWSPKVKEELSLKMIQLEASFRKASHDPDPERSRLISRFRYRIDTVFGQLTDQFQIKKVWARDRWHLGSRLLRKILAHTLAVFFNQSQERPLLNVAGLVN
jgi:hypothetical protein